MTPPNPTVDVISDSADDLRKEFTDESVEAAAAIAAIGLRGELPASALANLHRTVGTETAWMTGKLMDRHEALRDGGDES